jgi:hypothetical protein
VVGGQRPHGVDLGKRLTARALPGWGLVGVLLAGVGHADATFPGPGQWSGGAGVGILANTPERVTAGGREVDLRTSVIPGFCLGVRF